MEISNNTEAAESDSSSYIPDPLVNASESNTTTAVPITASAVLDANDKTLGTQSDEIVEQGPVYMIPRGNKPANEYSNPNLLLGVFHRLFPYGCGALEDSSRPVQINFREHVRYLLSNLLKHLKRKHTPEYEKLFIDQVEDSSEVVNGSNHRSTTELSSSNTK
ncbi:unnamed protein product [Rotaria magnacalcarata]|uniref:Uncharacterized protein n=2 Tax=Rotaria magnacalcarata TaxID=392030 RepID=A0A8S2RXV0_9BILA|nr:unnamed protein product [Rotaria magnacalcarata]